MTALLDSVAISNFRSIAGRITVPLASPVVLIHGANGAGKTSVLSAIELALTGELPDMRRTDPSYELHLLHRGTKEGQITLSATGLGSAPSFGNVTVRPNGSDARPLLNATDARFFSERCYLAQSTLGRLLEIYQYADPRQDSPLTRFVKDLLGLDQLDALIDGLKMVGDVRNVRKLLPEYRRAEEKRAEFVAAQATATKQLSEARERESALRTELRLKVAALEVPPGNINSFIAQTPSLREFLSFAAEEKDLVNLARRRRQLAALREDWQALARGPQAADREAAEAEEREAAAAAAGWRQTTGQQLESKLDELRATFPDLPSLASAGPDVASSTAAVLVDTEVRRCNSLVSEDDAIALRLRKIEQTIARARERIRIIDEKLSQIAGNTEELSRVLAALVPHIRDQECPVCGRDFGEISKEPLVAHLSAHVARLTEQAGKLQALLAEKGSAVTALVGSERERDDATSRRLSQDARLGYKARAAQLTAAARKLAELGPQAEAGAAILRRDGIARKHLAELRDRDKRGTEVRRALNELCIAMAQPAMGEAEPIAEGIGRLERQMLAEDARLTGLQQCRAEALSACLQLNDIDTYVTTTAAEIEARQKVLDALTIALKTSEHRRSAAKEIAAAAQGTRTTIVSRVFNDSLNAIWHDLFIRLAPTEPFVPAFKLPSSSDRAVVALLETVHRSGGLGGAPAAMLSAGNLNTAALTLFLALHLSVKAQLPWLILDDPVQSLDEVHIAQFAALLRALSKQHDRQIILAVHDRQLFEYLALELGPAFEGDQLITVELGRSAAGATTAEPRFRCWTPDSAVAA